MNDPSQRLSPEQLLAQVELEERQKRRGRLKVFLAMPRESANPSKCSTRVAAGESEVKMLWFVRCNRNTLLRLSQY